MIKNLICPLCKSDKIRTFSQNYQGCVENTYFDILHCDNCQSRFIDPSLVQTDLYDLIYGSQGEGGYERYFDVIDKVKKSANPLKTLAQTETTYLPLYSHLTSILRNNAPVENYKILEVGCGYGYTTYGVKQLGFDVTGIDLSTEAINIAKANFGDYYQVSQLQELPDSLKYDLIFANEVIEHLDNLDVFMENLLKHLKPGGVIHLTTPNKDYALAIKPSLIWETILPPHHTLWITQKGMQEIAKRYNLDYSEFDFGLSSGDNENRLNEARRLLNNNLPTPQIYVDKQGVIKPNSELSLPKKIYHLVINNAAVRLVSTLALKFIWQKPKYKTQGIFLK